MLRASDCVAIDYNRLMHTRLLDLLVCPLCKGRLYSNADHTELVCRGDRLAYPVRDGVPVMLEAEARVLPETEEFSDPS